MSAVFLGIDLGTSGMRALACDENGSQVASTALTWTGAETDPNVWQQTLQNLLDQLIHQLPSSHHSVALSVCSTSGTILALDPQGEPLEQAWLYSDPRGHEQAQQLGIPSSWGLCRWVWWQQSHPERARSSLLAHPTDFLLQSLGAEPHVTDHTSALKSGFDLGHYQWPADWFLEHGLDLRPFPRVVSPGTPLGTVASGWGLPSSLVLVAGCTDGCAAQLATGAITAGQISTSLGTTLIFKGTSTTRIQTQNGSIYSHLHPDRKLWFPGAASSCGAGVLPHFFPEADLAVWDEQARPYLPTGLGSYPLTHPGERYPVSDPNFPGLLPPNGDQPARFYAALLEGVALVERLGIERLEDLGVSRSPQIWTTGGGCKSSLWLRIRASVLQRELILPRYPQPAMGAAILAAAGYWGCSVQEAAAALVQTGPQIQPRSDWIQAYESQYQDLCQRVSHLI